VLHSCCGCRNSVEQLPELVVDNDPLDVMPFAQPDKRPAMSVMKSLL